MTTISVELSESLMLRVEEAAHARSLDKASYIRATLEKALETSVEPREVSCYDLARDLAGSLKGLPTDLATNPKYLEGFGG